MSFNTRKTVCMIFNPKCKRLVISESFSAFVLDDQEVTFVSSFKYLGHIIDNSLNDDLDISREIKCLFTRTNILIRRFGKSSVDVKKKLFRTFCLCFYDVALWCNFTSFCFNKLASCYYKCMKSFFGYRKYSSVTGMLLDLSIATTCGCRCIHLRFVGCLNKRIFKKSLPSFNTVICNARTKFNLCAANVMNRVIQAVIELVSV